MPGKVSWHSEPPATWLFNFNGLHQMFQAKGYPRNQNRRLPAPSLQPTLVPSKAEAILAAGTVRSGWGPPLYLCLPATRPILGEWTG